MYFLDVSRVGPQPSLRVTADRLSSDKKSSTAMDGMPRHQTPPSSKTTITARLFSTLRLTTAPRTSASHRPYRQAHIYVHPSYAVRRPTWATTRPSISGEHTSCLSHSRLVNVNMTSERATRSRSRQRGPWPTTKGARNEYAGKQQNGARE